MTDTDTAATYDVDDEDGLPIWGHAEGDPLPGGTLAVFRIGVGTRCETWLAWSAQMWCPVSVKLARPHQVDSERAVKSLRREVTALSGASHPGLPRLIGDGSGEPVPHLVMEYIDGPALDEELDRTGPMAATDVALMCVQILGTVSDLHRRGLAHLDLKPENIVLRDGRPIVIDFGSTRRIGAKQPAGKPIGTAGYAAPEQEDCEPISATMDCYGVGAIMYESLTCEATGSDNGFVLVPPVLFGIVTGLLEADPRRRMTAPEAMLALAGAAPAERRPWPRWLDTHLRVPVSS
ncbi:MAG TPA: serine/threonine-protein kinase [Pseudonocardiaceae bacterium]|nr:serine/threonine-protein kinase [Pseudonocardiaceae bacterium]